MAGLTSLNPTSGVKQLTTNLSPADFYQGQRGNVLGGGQYAALPDAGFTPTFQTAAAANPEPKPQSPVEGIGVQQPAPVVDNTQGALGPMPDPAAIRRRLLGSTPGATEAAGMPYNATFDEGVSNLYGNAMAKMAGYDQQQGRLMTDYEKNRSQQLQNQDLATKQLMDKLAFQGILSSGITTDQRALLGQKYGSILDKLASTQARGLEDIATGRLNTQSQYQQGLGSLENQYTQSLSDWVQQQAQQQAQRQQQQASDAANAQLLAQLQAMQQKYTDQMIALMQPKVGA